MVLFASLQVTSLTTEGEQALRMYQGAKYEFPCALDRESALTFQAVQLDNAGNVGLEFTIESGVNEVDLVVGPNHLNEFYAAINAALGAAADNGIRLINEDYEETFKRLYLNDVVEAPKPEPALTPATLADVIKNLGHPFPTEPFGNLFANAASRAARDE